MKPFYKHSFILLLLLGGVLFSCNAKKEGGDTTVTTEETTEHGGEDHVHTFACPMHPEVQGKEGEKCNKCGMPLEHMDNIPVKGNYKMEFKTPATTIAAGKPVMLSFKPKNKDNVDALVPLDVEHEKKIHLIVVSEDLSWFDHIHPEFQADGSYVVTETFPNGGNYVLYADYKPSGSTHQLEKINIQVEGKKKPAVSFTAPKLKANAGEFAVELKPDGGQFLSNMEIHFDGQFTKSGKRFDVNSLQSYLGAKGHMVGIHIASKNYVHLHPEVENENLHFHATFPEPGLYRVWLQFIAEDKLHTVDFTMMVEQGSGAEQQDEGQDEDHSDHDH